MSFMDQIGSILNQYKSGATPDRAQAAEHYDEIARSVPPNVLESTIGPALSGLDTGHLEQRIARSASAMTPEQRGSFLQTILAGLAGGGAGTGVGLPALLNRIGASPAIAADPTQASPEDVAKVTTYAKENQPDVFHRAMGFYAKHPTLVKVIRDSGDRVDREEPRGRTQAGAVVESRDSQFRARKNRGPEGPRRATATRGRRVRTRGGARPRSGADAGTRC
ncbi:MAG: hypothetical protein M3167_05300 [Acidobacteriota bacterium]|nr:hypothetical protein [Acidobacteriota bacterium]